MKPLRFLIFTLIFAFALTSCYKQETISSKNKVAQEQAAINSTDAIDYCDSLDNDIFEMGQTIGKFVDGLIKDGEVLFDQRNIGLNTYLDVNYKENDTIPFSEMAQLISDTFDIELSLASEFFDMLLDNKTFLVNLSTQQ